MQKCWRAGESYYVIHGTIVMLSHFLSTAKWCTRPNLQSVLAMKMEHAPAERVTACGQWSPLQTEKRASLPEMEALHGPKTLSKKWPTQCQPRAFYSPEAAILLQASVTTCPPPPVPPVLLMQNLSPKDIAEVTSKAETCTTHTCMHLSYIICLEGFHCILLTVPLLVWYEFFSMDAVTWAEGQEYTFWGVKSLCGSAKLRQSRSLFHIRVSPVCGTATLCLLISS